APPLETAPSSAPRFGSTVLLGAYGPTASSAPPLQSSPSFNAPPYDAERFGPNAPAPWQPSPPGGPYGPAGVPYSPTGGVPSAGGLIPLPKSGPLVLPTTPPARPRLPRLAVPRSRRPAHRRRRCSSRPRIPR